MSRLDQIEKDKKFITVGDTTDPNSIKEHELYKIGKTSIMSTEGESYYIEFCWPIAAKQELIDVCTERQKLQKALDDSMSLIYRLSNKYAKL